MIRFAVILLAATLSAWPLIADAESSSEERIAVAVLPFQLSDSSGVTDALIRPFQLALEADPRITVVSPSPGFSGHDNGVLLAEARAVASAGKALGADFVVAGILSEYIVDAPREEFGDRGSWVQPVRISATVRVVEVRSEGILVAKDVSGIAQHQFSKQDSGRSLGGDPTPALEIAAQRLVDECMDEIRFAAFPAVVTERRGRMIDLDTKPPRVLGPGITLQCYRKKGNDKPKKQGEILLLNAADGDAVAEVRDEQSPISVGDFCRMKPLPENSVHAAKRQVTQTAKRPRPPMLAPNF